MLNQLWQEILTLKKDTCFVRNLSATAAIAIVVTLSLSEVYEHPARLGQQKRLDEFSTLISAGMVIRTVSFARRQF
ncbi:hypothetical protein STA3757_15430 [Stanieria sp. NIES-3757]|nr:hypothetical protein STA3757_15430 [Stanieria sp. NIES-3757]